VFKHKCLPSLPYLSVPRLSVPAAPRHTQPRLSSPRLPCPTTLYLAEPCLPHPTVPLQAPPRLPNHAHRTIPVQSMPRLPYCAKPNSTKPNQTTTSHACRALPCLSEPRQTTLCPACRTLPIPNGPQLASPSLPWFKRYSMPNLALIAFSRSLSTTWNKPNPHPALALLSGLPAPIPTCKPQRLIKLITSTVLN